MTTYYGGKDLIRKCPANPGSAGYPCAETTMPASSSWTHGGVTYNGYRLIYAIGSDFRFEQLKGYVYKDKNGTRYPECSSNTDSRCIKLYGINKGQYRDMTLSFPAVENGYNIADKSTSHNFTILQHNRNVTLRVKRQLDEDNEVGPEDLCLYEGDRLIACQDRIAPPKPEIFACNHSNVSCSSTHFEPKIIASISSAGDNTKGIVHAARTGLTAGGFCDFQ